MRADGEVIGALGVAVFRRLFRLLDEAADVLHDRLLVRVQRALDVVAARFAAAAL